MLSPTGSSSSVHSGGSAPTRRSGADRGTVSSPGFSPCAWRRATGGAAGDNAGRRHGTHGSWGRGRSSSTTPAAAGSVAHPVLDLRPQPATVGDLADLIPKACDLLGLPIATEKKNNELGPRPRFHRVLPSRNPSPEASRAPSRPSRSRRPASSRRPAPAG